MDAYSERVEDWTGRGVPALPQSDWATRGDAGSVRKLGFAELWHALSRGEYVIRSSRYADEQCIAELQRVARPRALKPRRLKTLQRVLLGESPKVVAHDLGAALSSVASASGDCLSAIGAGRWASRAPVWLVMAAHAGAGLRLPAVAVRQLDDAIEVVCPRPDAWLKARLTRAEYDVSRPYLEGESHVSIALRHRSATRTVANHLAAVFRKLGVSGRGELLSRVIRAQWPLMMVNSSARATESSSPRPT